MKARGTIKLLKLRHKQVKQKVYFLIQTHKKSR